MERGWLVFYGYFYIIFLPQPQPYLPARKGGGTERTKEATAALAFLALLGGGGGVRRTGQRRPWQGLLSPGRESHRDRSIGARRPVRGGHSTGTAVGVGETYSSDIAGARNTNSKRNRIPF